jgi:radical SAM superfamily enzyme YgiQ (UPF0313 family)
VSFKTPKQIADFVNEKIYRLDMGVQYLGDEPNSYRKDWDSSAVRMVVFANWAYEQAAGNQAIPLVYRTVNEFREDFLCDRSYFHSTPRDLRTFENGGIPVFGVETKHQLMDFDVVGTSISYPVLSINFMKQLLMSDIPATWEDRETSTGQVVKGRKHEPERWPFIIVGGQCYGAPEVVANVADAVFCGEVEDETNNPGLGKVLERVDHMKKSGRWNTDRRSCYADLAREFNFLYFPQFVDIHYGYEYRESVDAVAKGMEQPTGIPSKQVIGYSTNIPGLKVPFVKRIVKDMDSVQGLTNPPLLYIDPGMGAGDAEVGRGCPAWCSFCALTYRQKPYRQRSVDYMVNFTKELVSNTGGIHIAPFSPDFPMHTQKKKLIGAILENVTDDVDASSMRVDDFIADPSYILLQAHGGMDTVTLGVEGNSQRMRDLVGKGAADEDVKEAVARGIQAGIRKFKLYMIAALPGEDEGDIFRIMALAKDLADIRDGMGSNAHIQFSWTPMLIEGNTPFQWFAPTSSNYALGQVWEEFRDLKIDFKLGGKAQRDKLLYFQLTQRASREVGLAMAEAVCEMNAGCWGGAPKGLYEAVEKRLYARGFLNGIADCYDERQKHDMFGWEMVDQGINVELMWVTYQQMVEFLENTTSDTYDEMFGDDYHGNEWIERCDTKCFGKTCGVCDADDLKIRRNYIQGAASEIDVDLTKVKVIDQKSTVMKIRCKVDKGVAKRFVMNDHFRYAVRRAAYRAGVPIAKRTVKFTTDNLKFKDWTCGTDFLEFATTKKLSKQEVAALIDVMNVELKGHSEEASIQIKDWTLLPAKADSLRQDVDLSLFEMELDVDPATAQNAIKWWHEQDYIKMVFREESRQAGLVTEEVNAREYVDDMWLVKDGHRLLIRMTLRGKASPYLVYAALFQKKSWIEAAKYPAVRVDAFVENDTDVIDFFRPVCEACEKPIPVNLLDKPYDPTLCPRCKDEHEGKALKEAVLA